jgi:hypothetical protein
LACKHVQQGTVAAIAIHRGGQGEPCVGESRARGGLRQRESKASEESCARLPPPNPSTADKAAMQHDTVTWCARTVTTNTGQTQRALTRTNFKAEQKATNKLYYDHPTP